ncbi:hypothetical protein [Candidatus Nitrosotenuis chungbukensis]|uniref:hypothetical protein n=1 Tax=Candidatus Nitrosotenuis chungbukensis TaxID=1353246 RepID=UPI000A851420|nr:hypothetical protein [Candidatus Nitrosotenuis chungbukensis]
MNQKLWLDGLDGIIPGGVSTTDFSKVINADKNTARKILEELARNHIGRFDGEVMEFDDGDKIKAVMFALEKGIPVDEAAEHLDWKDFEGLTAQILDIKDFAIIRNLILTNPRMEIDVIGIKFGVAMLIDCKHWKRHSQSALEKAVLKQVERTKQYVAKTKGAIAAPAIVTLYQDKVSFINNVPIVPIFQFASFVDEFYGNLEDIETIRTE